MPDGRFHVEAVKDLLASAKNITILTHLNPDGDTIGTGLGIFNLLSKEKNRRVEIVNASNMLPKYLDFLPNFSKIKHTMDFEESLIIACDCGNIKRLGFDLEGREVLNIDHHKSNDHYGKINVIIPEYAAASQVAYRLFKELYTIDTNTAKCFYTALLSDTRYFTTSSVDQCVFEVAKELVDLGIDPAEVAFNFTQRKSLSSVRILQKALQRLELSCEAKVATLYVTKEDVADTGATMPDMEGIVDYARSLVTVEIALFVIELQEGIRVSIRSKNVDVVALAEKFGGGGHTHAAGFSSSKRNLQETIDIMLQIIKETGLTDGK